MPCEDIIILIPCHSLEDFPVDLGETEAASLLNAYAVSWHPRLIASAKVLPRWQRADDPPESSTKRWVFVPTCSESWLPAGWAERVANEGSIVVRGISERSAMIKRAMENVPDEPPAPADLIADFFALGTNYLLVELLTRKMRQFGNIDEVHLQREAVAAAEAAVAGDRETAQLRLKNCFQVLMEARERFYPVECYLLDLCLLSPGQVGEPLRQQLIEQKPINLMVTASDLGQIANDEPDTARLIREAWDRRGVDVLVGSWNEFPQPLSPVGSVIWQMQKGARTLRSQWGHLPVTWGTRRFGLFAGLPQLLKKSGYTGALHLAMDDGIYPDYEQSKFRWEGVDGSFLESFSRIPLAADSATSFLRFPDRMSESMDNDHVAGVAFARWPELQAPFFSDLARARTYAAPLGRWITFEEFFEHTDSSGRLSTYKPYEYLAPFLTQAVAREESQPLDRIPRKAGLRSLFETGQWLKTLDGALRQRPHSLEERERDEARLEQLPEALDDDCVTKEGAQLEQSLTAAAQSLSQVLLSGAGREPGYLFINPCAFPRTITVEFPGSRAAGARRRDGKELSVALETMAGKPPAQSLAAPPSTGAAPSRTPNAPSRVSQGVAGAFYRGQSAVVVPLDSGTTSDADWQPPASAQKTWKQWDAEHRLFTLTVPPAGYVWYPLAKGNGSGSTNDATAVPMAEGYILRNEQFEVHINPETGGIRQIKGYGRSPNRLSQQLNFRFPRERTFTLPSAEGVEPEEVKTQYGEMKCRSMTITSAGPALGEIVTTGEIVDQKNGQRLAGFTQAVRVYRGRPFVEVSIELDIVKAPDAEPWQNYYAARFAWNDETAALSRGQMLATHEHGPSGERLETTGFLELATPEQRTTILTHNLPYHRKTGYRMLDVILATQRENRRQFRLTIALDQSYPLQAAWDATRPVLVIPTQSGPPKAITGWFFHLSAKTVQLVELLPLVEEPAPLTEGWEADTPSTPVEGATARPPQGIGLRLVETEGRPVRCKVRTYRQPKRARARDFHGKTLAELSLEGDAVLVDFTPFELQDVEIFFE